MEYAYFIEENNSNATTFALADFGAESAEQSFDVIPRYVRAGRMREDRFQCSLMCAFHGRMVPAFSTEHNRCDF